MPARLAACCLALSSTLAIAGCAPLSAGTPRPTPTASPTLAPAPTVGEESAPRDVLNHDRAVVKAHAFDPGPHPARTPDGFGGTLYAWKGICSGSADGYCQEVFFFAGARFLGTDARNPSTQIIAFYPAGTGSIAVQYAGYFKTDPLCCPRGRTVTVVYHWNGKRLLASRAPPGR